jgi:hypothetical protein
MTRAAQTARVFNIDSAISDKRLLGAALGDSSTWAAWRVILKAAFALSLSEVERETFAQLAGGRTPPLARVAELWAVAGRRSGKSRMAALLCVYLACFVDYRGRLARGEVGQVIIVSPTKEQSRAIKNYIIGFLEASPILAKQVESVTAGAIKLKGGIEISVHAGSFRSVRGRTLLAAILDEVAFLRDESSALPDKELVRAILPALATTGGMLIGISSPYRKVGILAERHRDHFGRDSDVLVVQAPSLSLNPTLDRGVIKRAASDDPEAARSEWDAEFRSDLSSYLDDTLIDSAVVNSRPIELPPRDGIKYVAFADASAGRHDHFTLCIGHLRDSRFVADVVRGRAPPFDPKAVAAEYAALAKDYGCRKVIGDAYAGEWTAGAFKDAGIDYERSKLSRSELYVEALPHFARNTVEMPEHPRLIRELRMLERRTHRSGKDSIDHPRGGSDDYANVLAGAIYFTSVPTAGEFIACNIRYAMAA